METFHWDKYFETGLPEVDRQHHCLIDLIHEFGNSLTANELLFDDIEAIFEELFEYANYHFWEEELLMSNARLGQHYIDEHIKKHHDFLLEITFLQQDISSTTPAKIMHLLDFLTHWLAYHILGEDQNMARQIRGHWVLEG